MLRIIQELDHIVVAVLRFHKVGLCPTPHLS